VFDCIIHFGVLWDTEEINMDESFVSVGGAPEEVRTYKAHVSSAPLLLRGKTAKN
jgi:hypothetical protein